MRTLFVVAFALVVTSPAALGETIRLEISDASQTFDPRTAEPVVAIRLTAESAAAFGRFTAARVGEAIDLKVGGKVLSSPVVREPVLGGSLQISGFEGVAQATEIAVKIRAGDVAVEIDGAER